MDAIKAAVRHASREAQMHMVEVATPAQVWSLVVGFQALPDWQPAIASSKRELRRRNLSLGGDGKLCEKIVGYDAMSCPYEPVQRRRTRTTSTNPYNVDKPVRHDHVCLDFDV